MLIMATMMIPFETIMIPLYMVVTKMGLHDSYAGLILPFLTNAFGVFLMRQFLITFPDEVLDAARIDGASEPRIFANIVLPNSGPAIATLAILTFRSQWDNLLWPLLVVQSDEMKTIPLYITKFMAETHSDEGIMMAVATMASLPMFILFFTMSNYFISTEGLHSTVKGSSLRGYSRGMDVNLALLRKPRAHFTKSRRSTRGISTMPPTICDDSFSSRSMLTATATTVTANMRRYIGVSQLAVASLK